MSRSTEKQQWDIVWRNVIIFIILHAGAVYGGYLYITKTMWKTVFCLHFIGVFSAMSITAGAHRLWSHRCYKARLPLRLFLMAFNCLAFQDSVIDWSRDHRMHHRYTDTDADPYNSRRGFFFSHIGWLLVRKHPEIKAKGHTIDMSDLESDPILKFQKKYYIILMILLSWVIPSYIPTLWGEPLWNAFFVCGILRYVISLNTTWLINSAAHMWGIKPYDEHISAVDGNLVSFIAYGEGFHNYHHTFPWDYKTAELGNFSLNFTKLFIDSMAKVGLAYDMKTAPAEVIEGRKKRVRTYDTLSRSSSKNVNKSNAEVSFNKRINCS